MDYVMTLRLFASNNASIEEVRAAVERCVAQALHIYAYADKTRPHRLTGGPMNTFGYADVKVTAILEDK